MSVEQTSKEYFKGLSILHGALAIGQVLIGGILYYISGDEDENAINLLQIFTYVVPLLLVGGLLGSTFLSKRLIEKAKSLPDLKDKLGSYRGALIVKWALMEGPTLIAMMAFFLTSNLNFLIMAGAMLAFFVTTNPSISKTIQDLSLSRDEQVLLGRPDEIVARINSK